MVHRVINFKKMMPDIGRAGSEWSEGVKGLKGYRVV